MANSPHIDEVRRALMETLKDLRNKEDPMDIKRALAVAQVAGVLVESAKVENEYLKITGQDKSEFLEIPPDPSVAHLGTTVRPGDQNGITSITRHRLGAEHDQDRRDSGPPDSFQRADGPQAAGWQQDADEADREAAAHKLGRHLGTSTAGGT